MYAELRNRVTLETLMKSSMLQISTHITIRVMKQHVLRKIMDVNERERLSNITVRHKPMHNGTCLMRHTKGPWKCVGLYKMSEYPSLK